MTIISFPRSIPESLPVAGLSFDLNPMIEQTPLRSGKIITSNLGPSFWQGRWQSALLNAETVGIVRGWYASLLSSEAFYGWDKLREYPLAYSGGWGNLTVGGNPFNGQGQISSVAGNLVEITIKTLPNSTFVLSVGDYIAFDYGVDSRALHLIVAGGTTDGSGNVTVEVRPPIQAGWTADSAVYLYRAAAKMIILPKTWSCPIEPPYFGKASFEAVQTL